MTERRKAERITCAGKLSVAVQSWTGAYHCARCGRPVRKPVETVGKLLDEQWKRAVTAKFDAGMERARAAR